VRHPKILLALNLLATRLRLDYLVAWIIKYYRNFGDASANAVNHLGETI
jgi:hypothetical protein